MSINFFNKFEKVVAGLGPTAGSTVAASLLATPKLPRRRVRSAPVQSRGFVAQLTPAGIIDTGYNRSRITDHFSPTSNRQGLGSGVGRGLGVGADRGVGVGLGAAVG